MAKKFGRVITFAIITVLGIVMLVSTIKDKIELGKEPAQLESMTPDDFYAGRFVEGNIYEMWDEYAYMTESDSMFGIKYNTKTTAHYFAFPLLYSYEIGEPRFVSVSVRSSSDYATAQKMSMESASGDGELTTVLHVKGKLTKLKGDGKKLFDEYLISCGMTPATDAVYYTINAGNNGGAVTYALIIAIVFVVAGLAGGFFSFVRMRR